MKKCSFCSHENEDDAKFCANCGRTYVVKEIRQKLGKAFEVLGYIAIGFIFLAFIFELVDNIIWKATFFTYPIWLFKYILLGAMSLAYLYAHKVKSESLSLLMTMALVVHILIFFPPLPLSAVFSGFSGTFYIFSLILLVYFLAIIIFNNVGSDWGPRIARFYPLVTVGVISVYTFLSMLHLFIYGFGTTYIRTMAFSSLATFFYLAAVSVLLALPLIDKEIDTMEKQGEEKPIVD